MSFDHNPVDDDPHAECRREIEQLRARITEIRQKLEEVVCTVGRDRGVVMLSEDSPTHYDSDRKCLVYDHEHFSPLGDALIEIYELTAGEVAK